MPAQGGRVGARPPRASGRRAPHAGARLTSRRVRPRGSARPRKWTVAAAWWPAGMVWRRRLGACRGRMAHPNTHTREARSRRRSTRTDAHTWQQRKPPARASTDAPSTRVETVRCDSATMRPGQPTTRSHNTNTATPAPAQLTTQNPQPTLLLSPPAATRRPRSCLPSSSRLSSAHSSAVLLLLTLLFLLLALLLPAAAAGLLVQRLADLHAGVAQLLDGLLQG